MTGATAPSAPTMLDLESAIIDAEGASAVLQVLENELTGSIEAGWKTLGLEPRTDLCVTALLPIEHQAMGHATRSLQAAVAEVSRVFYAIPNGTKAR